MDWLPLVTAAFGAGVGIGSTLLADRARWRRDRSEQYREFRRDAYGDFFMALSQARNSLRKLATTPASAVDRRVQEATDVWVSSGAYEQRIRLSLVAPGHMNVHIGATYDALQVAREEISGGASAGDPRYEEALLAYHRQLDNLRVRMQEDLLK
ncbi:hypothetical protein [Streptomyces chartreusis]